MGYKSSFKMGKTYGANDLNEITKTFVSGGVGDAFENGLPYNLADINGIISASASSGAVPETVNSLKVEFENSKVKINPGRAVMNDGSICIIDDEGLYLDYNADEINYVYIFNDMVLNDNTPICSTFLPSDNSDYVLLAKIGADGVITDKRDYVKGKILHQSSNLSGIPFCVELPTLCENPSKDDIIREDTKWISYQRKTVICDDVNVYKKILISGKNAEGCIIMVAILDFESQCFSFTTSYDGKVGLNAYAYPTSTEPMGTCGRIDGFNTTYIPLITIEDNKYIFSENLDAKLGYSPNEWIPIKLKIYLI